MVGRLRLVNGSEDNHDTFNEDKEVEYEKVISARYGLFPWAILVLMYVKENRDYVIPIRRMEGLPASGTSALLARRAGLKDSGSVASLAYGKDTASTSAFDAVGQGSRLPRSSSVQQQQKQGHYRKTSGPFLSDFAYTGSPT